MSERLLERFDDAARRAARWEPGQDPSPVLDALGHALWLAALGELTRASAAQLAALRAVGRRALLGLGAERGARSEAEAEADAGDTDETDPESGRAALGALEAVARAGLQALSGPARAPAGSLKLHVPDHTLARMVRGETDGLTAGRYAAHLLACERCQESLRALRFGASLRRAEPLAVAAAAPASVRAPSSGRRVATLGVPPLEAVLFEDRRLAVYADGHDPVRLVADGLTTEVTLGGYWLGRLAEGVDAVDATVHVGGQQVRWTFVLGPQSKP